MRRPNLEGTTAFAGIQMLGNTPRGGMADATSAAAPQPSFNTGRYLLVFNDDPEASRRAVRLFENRAGMKVASTSEFRGTVQEEDLDDMDALVYEDLGVALVDGDSLQMTMLAESANGILLQPEKIVFMPDFLTGNDAALFPPTRGAAHAATQAQATWGITATQVLQTHYTGKGVKVAVLDTGFDSAHPDFAGRSVTAQSFVPGQLLANDVVGHGTHCVGTSCGHRNANGVRYGVAHGADIFVGKVLGDNGRGAQAWILNGMNWAVSQGCQVISLSLGSPVAMGDGFDPAYERAARFARSRNCVVVAAAGNESKRPNAISPVGSPANCPSVLAVAAVDSAMQVAPFSCGELNATQAVDITGPGVDVYSAWPTRSPWAGPLPVPAPTHYHTISGTSMATPHVAGIVALLWEKNPNFTADEITRELLTLATGPRQPSTDFGSGFVQAP